MNKISLKKWHYSCYKVILNKVKDTQSPFSYLHYYDSVVGLPLFAEVHIDFALNVHKNQSAGESNGHYDQFGPKWPL